jgi:ubiquinone/menaquinone biosynthesis C-methylase UbiE
LLHRIDNQISISNTWFIVNLTEIVGAQSRRPSGLLGRLMGLLMNWRHRPLSQWTIELMSIQPDDFVLDIGCGGGVAIGEIAKIATNGFVAGVDYSEIMVRQALKYNSAAVCEMRVAVKNGSISNLPFKDESFDKAYAIESFNFWPDPIAGLKEVHRILRPRGLVAIATGWSREMPNQQKYEAVARKMRFSLYSGSQVVEMLTAAGFLQAQFTVKAGKSWLCAIGVK